MLKWEGRDIPQTLAEIVDPAHTVVIMHDIQNDNTGPAPSLQAAKTTAIRPAGSSTDRPGPQPVNSSVQSPAAVPSANVTSTVSQ